MRGGQFLYLLRFLFLLFEDAFARARALGFAERERERSGVCGVSRDDVKNHSSGIRYETLQSAFTITKH